MHPVCFHIGERAIYWYGVMMALAFLAGMINWWQLGRKEGRDWAFASDLAFWLMLAGILGARTAYVISDWRYFLADPAQILRIDQGGLIYYGGFIGATLVLAIMARVRHESFLGLCDFGITSIPLGHALGRIGCFLNGCCYGTPTDLPWAVPVNGVLRHPIQLCEAALNLLIFFFLRALYRRGGKAGHVMGAYLVCYSVVRFLMEFGRGDERLRWSAFTTAQWLSVFLLVVGLLLWCRSRACHNEDKAVES